MPWAGSQSLAMSALERCSTVDRRLSPRSSSVVSRAFTRPMTSAAASSILDETSGVTRWGRMRFCGSARTTRSFCSMAGSAV